MACPGTCAYASAPSRPPESTRTEALPAFRLSDEQLRSADLPVSDPGACRGLSRAGRVPLGMRTVTGQATERKV